MPIYRLYCETEEAYVTGESVQPPTECYNDAEHTIRDGSVTLLKKGSGLRSVTPITVLKAGFKPKEYAEINGSSWESVSTFLLNAALSCSSFVFIASMSGSSGTGYIRVFDVSNNTTLASVEVSGTDKTIYRTEVETMSDDDAIVEIQMREEGSSKVRLYYASSEI